MARKATSAKPARPSLQRNSVLDLARMTVREVNQLLHDADGGDFLIKNPRGAHAIAAGLDGPFNITIDGHVGYYCAGMNKQASDHHRRQCRHGRGREHDVGPRAREGRRLAVGGRHRLRRAADRRRQRLGALRHLAARARYRRQGLGRPHVGVHGAGRHAGGAGRRRRRAGRFHLRGASSTCAGDPRASAPIASPRTWATRTRPTCASCSMRRASAARSTCPSSRRYGSARKLYNFHIDNLGSY